MNIYETRRYIILKLLANITTVKLGVYYNTDLEAPAFNRDPAFIGDQASIIEHWPSPHCIYQHHLFKCSLFMLILSSVLVS